MSGSIPEQRDVYTVSRLNREVRELLEGSLPLIWVEGELSNVARPSSGHLYLTLKDAAAQVRCAMFRTRNRLLGFRPEDGKQVLIRARVSLYEGRGEFQLVVEHMEEAGTGALRRAFDLLKARLAAEGLFDPARRRPLPALPHRIGVITSPTGAAIRDIVSVLRRRFPSVPVLIYPVPVQGSEAPPAIVEALALASRRQDCDVLILARGGGSLEDLWAFNEEAVARAVHASAIPVVTGIGHEVDVSICDFVADRRAATPSAAAELVTPSRDELLQRLTRQQARLLTSLRRSLRLRGQALEHLGKRLRHPGRRLQDRAQRVDGLEHRLRQAQAHVLARARARLQETSAHLQRQTPRHRLRELAVRRANLHGRLLAAMGHGLTQRGDRLTGLGRALDAVSPLATLARGFAIVRRTSDGTVVRDAARVRAGEQVEARLARGALLCRVEATRAESEG